MIRHVKVSIQEIFLPAEIGLGKIHLFPSPYRPRVIVLDIDAQEQLALLSAKIGQGIQLLFMKLKADLLKLI